MGRFTLRHKAFYWVGLCLSSVGFVAGFLGFVRGAGGWFIGLGWGQVEAYDMRPFPVGGGLEGQLWAWALLVTGWGVVGVVSFALGLWLLTRLAPSQPRRSTSEQVWVVTQALVVVGMIGLLGLRIGGLAMPRADAYPIASLRGVERMGEIEFPQGTALVEARGYTGWHGDLRAVVLMPMDVLDGFLKSAPFEQPWTAQGPEWMPWTTIGLTSPSHWRPESVPDSLHAMGGEFRLGDGIRWFALADTRDDEMATVYFEWSRH
ncbi:MAG TPA: hypothetical protein QGH10_25625 [Armatimonadota bacterium]|nr:hypothetical protein [Armatimonadota bacterium]